jgi:hypothetical protein
VISVLRERSRRRRRGRWGLLQDRFDALAATTGPTTNHRRADRVGGAVGDTVTAHEIARTLDRATFDPGWADDDDQYQRTRGALRTLERVRR